jgi:hypothetical protein
LKLGPAVSNGNPTHEEDAFEPLNDHVAGSPVSPIPGGLGKDLLPGNQLQTALRRYALIAAFALAACASVGAYALHKMYAPPLTNQMWRPLLKSPGAVLVVIGNGPHEQKPSASPTQANLNDQMHGAYNHISFCDAVALSRISDVMGNYSKPYETKEADLASLRDLRERSVILIGAYNNVWTMRLIGSLRFHFAREGTLTRIVDAQNPQNRDWAVDYSKPYATSLYDYAVIARYADPTTRGSVLIIAGIGAYGTEAASDSVAMPHDIEKLLAGLPRGWENRNLEMVIKTAIVNGEPGPPDLLSAITW